MGKPNKTRRSSHLHLLPDINALCARSAGPHQFSLFADDGDLLVIVDMGALDGVRFLEVLERTRPKWVIDVRPVPVFYSGRVTRRHVFVCLSELGARYRDVSGMLGVTSWFDAKLNPGVIAGEISTIVGSNRALQGPVMFLTAGRDRTLAMKNALPRCLPHVSKLPWQLSIIE